MPRLSITQVPKWDHTGQKVHSHNVLRCSACRAALLDVMVVEPSVDVSYKYRADCPLCGDRSLPVEVAGLIVINRATEESRIVAAGFDFSDDNESVYIKTAIERPR